MHRRKQRTWRSGWRIGAANPEPSHIRYYESLFSLASGTTGIRSLRKEAVVLRKFRPDLAAAVNPPWKGREPLRSIRKAQQALGCSPAASVPTVTAGAAVHPSVEPSRKEITE